MTRKSTQASAVHKLPVFAVAGRRYAASTRTDAAQAGDQRRIVVAPGELKAEPGQAIGAGRGKKGAKIHRVLWSDG